MSIDIAASRKVLLEQLAVLTAEEEHINSELEAHFTSLVGRSATSSLGSTKSTSSSALFENSSIVSDLHKVERFAPVYESIKQNAAKMSLQVDDCRNLSERLSSIVRKLDTKQIRAQKALACTEDILNLKDCKFKIIAAIEEKNLVAAVGYIRQVHEIDEKAARTSEDYEIIVQKELEVKEMVRSAFQAAIAASDTNAVMGLCPLLQTLGLEAEARDNFLAFMEEKVFIGVSADAKDADATDPSTAYAQALSSVFNSTYLTIQKYLPMVIQGLENSLGDIYFLRKLHKRCEQEAGLVLKRYMKFRGVKDVINNLKSGNVAAVNHADLHSIMDELALLIQYCCKYSKYLRHVCNGAESKPRSKVSEQFNGGSQSVVVFSGTLDFDKMVDELVSKYYLEGEQWLMRQGMVNTLPKMIEEGAKLDECFFVLQKCGLRSLATHNIHAACATLNYISDLISSDLLNQANEMMNHSVTKLVGTMQDHISKYRKSITASDDGQEANRANNNTLAKGLTSAMSLASTLAGGVSSTSETTSTTDIVFHENGGFTLSNVGSSSDPWGVAILLEAFNIVELCTRYTDRLSKDLNAAGFSVFDHDDEPSNSNKNHDSKTKKGGAGRGSKDTTVKPILTSDADKLKVCKDNFENAKMLFSSALRHGSEKVVSSAQSSMKDILAFTIGKGAIYGGVKFDARDAVFDQQPILVLLPKIVTLPFETIVSIASFGLSERNKDMFVGQLADACCEKFELFINQTTFSLAGALKLEEIVRALSSLFSRHSSVPVRGKFSRLREIMMVLNADSGNAVLNDNYTTLTNNEVEAFFGLRIDIK